MPRYNLRSRPHFSPSFPTALANPSRRVCSLGSARRIPPVSPISLVRLSSSPTALTKASKTVRWLPKEQWIPPLSPIPIRSILKIRPDDVPFLPPCRSSDKTLLSAKPRKTLSWRRSLVDVKYIENRTSRIIRTYRTVLSMNQSRPAATPFGFSNTLTNRPPSVITRSALTGTHASRNMHGELTVSSDHKSSLNFPSDQFFRSVPGNLQPEVTLVSHRPTPAIAIPPVRQEASLMSWACSSIAGWFNVFRTGVMNMSGL
ncbi:hypothetical protein N7499_009473 [Penicillium canescens]|nr:hypothetical protein N7499_009473 [Penicillium canescens]KAJ6170138.1 hypothetical protein N7485_007484 [Penicillium canescens]